MNENTLHKLSILIQALLILSVLTVLVFKAFPANADEPAITEEPAFQFTLDDAEEALSGMLQEQGIADHIKATVGSARNPILYKYGKPFSVAIKTLKFDADKRTFSANLFFMDSGDVLSAKPISGSYTEMVEVPMLKQSLSKGQEITEDNIYTKLLPTSRLRADTVTDSETLIGKTPRRAISDNRPIRKLELMSPSIMEKGSVVTMRYQTPFMTISTTGEALQPGSEGDMIRVKNTESNITVSAKVISDSEVLVGAQPSQIQVSAR
ncbi:MAG: flagellar basal body P-ring formation chaperone FlgA [Rickettsiales bacterium]